MDIQKNAKRKTVQWKESSQQKKFIKEMEQSYKNISSPKKWEFDMQSDSKSDDEQSNNKIQYFQELSLQVQAFPLNQKKSQKTIQTQNNLKKAKLNRLSQQCQQPINLVLINRRISQNKQNYFKFGRFGGEEMEEQENESDKEKDYNEKNKMKFQIQKSKYCNEKFPKNF